MVSRYSTHLSHSASRLESSLILYGKNNPVKKVKNEVALMTAMRSAALYALNASSVEELVKSPPDEVSAFAVGLAKNTQQANRYNLYSLVLN